MTKKLYGLLETNPTLFLKIVSQNDITINSPVGPLQNTLLHQACLLGKEEIVTFLLEHGADINALNKYNDTPLALATREQQLQIVKLLLSRSNINMNTLNQFGFAPIHLAASNPDPTILELLIKSNCSLEVKNNKTNTTALLLAVNKKYTQHVKLLLQNGADVYAQNNQNLSCVELAIKRKDAATLEVLLFWGANPPLQEITPPELRTIIKKYTEVRESISVIKSLVLFNDLSNLTDTFPTLLQITSFVAFQNRACLNNLEKLPLSLNQSVLQSVPRETKAGFFFKKEEKCEQPTNKDENINTASPPNLM